MNSDTQQQSVAQMPVNHLLTNAGHPFRTWPAPLIIFPIADASGRVKPSKPVERSSAAKQFRVCAQEGLAEELALVVLGLSGVGGIVAALLQAL